MIVINRVRFPHGQHCLVRVVAHLRAAGFEVKVVHDHNMLHYASVPGIKGADLAFAEAMKK